MSTLSKTIVNPHDQFFRTAMTNRCVAKSFLTAHLPKDLHQHIDFDQLEIQPRTFINDIRKESAVDVLIKTTFASQEAYIYLLVEHQSTPDPLMPFRMIKYTCNIIDDDLKKQNTKKIPLIYPIVVYHGKRPYPFSTNVHDLIDAPKELIEQYFLQPFQLIDLGQIEDDALKQHTWAGIMEFALKHIFDQDILPFLPNITHFLQSIGPDGHDYLAIVLQYLLERAEVSDETAFVNFIQSNLSHTVGEKIMTIAERLELKGELRGKLEGELRGKLEEQQAIAKRMLAEGVNMAFISRITQLSIQEIEAL